jgi:hypothetical protein
MLAGLATGSAVLVSAVLAGLIAVVGAVELVIAIIGFGVRSGNA